MEEPRVPLGSRITDPNYEFARDARAELKEDIAAATIQFERDFYVLTEEELRGVWMGRMRPIVEDLIRPQVSPNVKKGIESDFEEHFPLWEYSRSFWYDGFVFDQETQQKVSKEDFFLHEPFHKKQVIIPLSNYLLSPPDPYKTGLAMFIARFCLKTYIMVITAGWLITRHRIVFDDYTTIRFIHDVEGDAVKRTDRIKNKFRTHTRLRALYPEIIIPKGTWGTAEEWDLQGRDESGEETLDSQVKAIGMRSVKQGSHPQYTFIDDVENEAHMNSPASRRETRTLFGALSFAAQLGLSKTVLSGTFYTPLGIHAQIMEMARVDSENGDKKATWDVIHLPAAYDWDTPQESLIYPTRLSHDIIAAKLQESEELYGDDLFARMQLFLDFKQTGRVEFDMSKWREIDLENPTSTFDHSMMNALRGAPIIMQIDSAWKNPLTPTGGKGANTAILCIAYPRLDGVVWRVLLDAIYDDTLTLKEGCAQAMNMAAAWKPWYILVEEIGQKVSGPGLADMAKERGLRYFMRLPRLGSGHTEGNIIPVHPRKTGEESLGKISAWKMARFKRLQYVWNEGRIVLNKDVTCLAGLREEGTDFPFGRKCDFLDAMALADDERMQAILPQNKMQLPEKYRRKPPRRVIDLSRYSGLTYVVR